jgi:tetratricopeptide (TPR) repeat protein
MPTFTDPRLRDLNEANRRAQELLDKGDYAAALQGFTDVKEVARALGVDASWPSWGLAICHDNLGDHAMAFEHMRDSLRVDPLNLGKQASFDVIVQHLRAALAAPDRADDDPSTPRLYQLLVQAGEADVAAHLAMARHLAKVDDAAGAMRILDAVTTLFPACREGWERKAALARQLGDAPLSRQCEVEAAGCAGTSAPYGAPRPVATC